MSAISEENRSLIQKLLSDKAEYDAFVYTPWRDALEELKRRKENTRIDQYLETVIPDGLPLPMKGQDNMVLFRSIATPNYEMYRFRICADVLNLKPVVFEYSEDKFVDVNELKRALGKLPFYKGMNRKGEPMIQYRSILDMSKCNGKLISSLHTTTGQSLVDFHHEFFNQSFPDLKDNVFELSSWVFKNGGHDAASWYERFLSLFLKHGILFENFMTTKHDIELTEEVVLPAIIRIREMTGEKPLIVALEPTDIEGSQFWHSYPFNT